MMDQASCPVSAFYEVAADKFRDASFLAKPPVKFCLIEGHESIDPMRQHGKSTCVNSRGRLRLDGNLTLVVVVAKWRTCTD